MREIKFRYWNTLIKTMVNNPKMPYKEGWTIEQLFSDRGWVWQQFTGLLDKSGNEIYEGDIVKQIDGTIRRIIWENGSCWGRTTLVKHLALLIDEEMRDCEIVGNIYENPELLTPSQE